MVSENYNLTIAVEWDANLEVPENRVLGCVCIGQGEITSIALEAGRGSTGKESFSFIPGERTRLVIDITGAQTGPGAGSSILIIETNYRGFSFFLRDVTRNFPLYIPDCAVAITTADDPRDYAGIAASFNRNGLKTRLQRFQEEDEESFESAAAVVRRQPNCPTWLGLSRDMRTFLVNFRENGEVWDWIQPQFHSTPVPLPENEDKPVRYGFFFGRGVGCMQSLRRWLEDGVLPILHAEVEDGNIRYHATAFASLETGDLLDGGTGSPNLRGTHYLVADSYGYGNMQTETQTQERQRRLPEEMEREEETVLYLRLEAHNTAPAPRYAWFKLPVPNAFHVGTTLLVQYVFGDGFARYRNATGDAGRVYLAAKLNGAAMPQEEMAVLLQPGERAVVDIFLPHRPIAAERAARLLAQDFSHRHQQVQQFWRAKLASAAQVRLPERRIQEMLNAGLLHLDLVTYGLEPQGVTAPCIGVYCPIGSESSPIVQFYDAMGWTDLAQRSLEYFIAKQHEDGFIQNFGGYMLETGAALWSMGEHYRTTGDDAWVRRIEPNLLKACDYLLRWSQRNQRPELIGRGFGMLDGKVGDPEDPYPIFMLNGYAYLGLSRAAEMLAAVNPAQAERLAQEAAKLKGFIRTALQESIVHSPVIPLGDGSWVPSVPPWAGYRGPVSLYADGGNWFTHGAAAARDSLVGPLYLVFQEVVGVDEPEGWWMLAGHAELHTERNAAFSQPYYSRHAWVHLKRGEVKPFLKTYYNTLAALADRDTYSFWEHFQLISPHKTHEEGWFLMQTRWMLYLEEGTTLRLMPGIPRRWLEDGQHIEIDGMRSYFGSLKVVIEPRLEHGQIRASIALTGGAQKAERVILRLPHPQRVPAKRCLDMRSGKELPYDAATECITLEPWNGKAEVVAEY